MPRPKKGTISKKAAVEKFLAEGMPNREVVAAVKKSYNLAVSPTYVSVIKSHRKKSLNGSAPKAVIGRAGGAGNLTTLSAAIEFIKIAGSVAAAKQALAAVEEIRQLA